MFTTSAATAGEARSLDLKSGFVRYEVAVKTLGIGGDNVSAINRKIIGQIVIMENGRIEGGLVIPVTGFDSNNTRRDRDVAKILKFKKHPAITFEITEINEEAVALITKADSGRVKCKTRLSAAGKSKIYDLVLGFHSEGTGFVRFTTKIDARFSDFGIRPPRFGLILKRSPDSIILTGDLLFEINKAAAADPLEPPLAGEGL